MTKIHFKKGKKKKELGNAPLDPTVRAWSSFHTGAPELVVVKLVSKELEGRNYISNKKKYIFF